MAVPEWVRFFHKLTNSQFNLPHAAKQKINKLYNRLDGKLSDAWFPSSRNVRNVRNVGNVGNVGNVRTYRT